jgi:hypothetical protein
MVVRVLQTVFLVPQSPMEVVEAGALLVLVLLVLAVLAAAVLGRLVVQQLRGLQIRAVVAVVLLMPITAVAALAVQVS